MKTRLLTLCALALAATGCERTEESFTYRTGEVTTKDIVVAVEAAGVVEPFLTVEVKSKASGEILSIAGETGDFVEEGTLLARIEKRVPRNDLAQAQARLEAARARRKIAETQEKRAKSLLESRTINDVDYEQSVLELANAKAEVVTSQVAVENARIALDDADVKAPITGTIIEKLVEKGQVISSPTSDVGGGTLMLKMADLSSVQIKALVNETDIGKIQPRQPVMVTVTSYPNQPFAGEVLKVEPQAMEDQTVTTFSVLITLDNAGGLLKPGMNADVDIRVAESLGVVSVPTAALRTRRDIPVAAELVGFTGEQVNTELARTAPERDAGGGAGNYQFANWYWVFVERGDELVPVNVETGLTDLDYSEVRQGLSAGDSVVLLPSSGLVQSQQRMQDRIRRFTSLPGMSRSNNQSSR